MRPKKIVKVLWAFASLVYWGFPVVQYEVFHSLEHPTNGLWVFSPSFEIYNFFLLFCKAPLPILIQISFALLTWFLLGKLFFRNA